MNTVGFASPVIRHAAANSMIGALAGDPVVSDCRPAHAPRTRRLVASALHHVADKVAPSGLR